MYVAQRRKEGAEGALLVFRHLDADQDVGGVGTLVAVVEQADVPVRAHARQELHQRARALGELEAVQQFVMRQRRAPAHHVADMLLGKLVVGQVQRVEAMLAEAGGDLVVLSAAGNLHANEDMRHAGVGDAVVELGHAARPHQLAEALEAAALFRDGHGEHAFAGLAYLGALGHKAQAVEVHVGAAGDCHQVLALELLALGVRLQARYGQRAGRLEDAAGVLEHVLHARADRVGIAQDDVVDQFARDAEGLLADQPDRGAVREQAHFLQLDALAGIDRALHRVRIDGLHADHLDLGAHRLDVRGDTGDQPAAADGDEHRVDRARMLAQDFHGDGALAGDHLGVVERVDEGQLVLFLQHRGVVVRVAVGLAVQHDLDPLAAALAHGVDLHLRRGHRHGDDGLALQPGRRQRHALRVIAGGGGDHAALDLFRRQRGHLVVRAAQLEGEDRLGVLALEPDRVAGAGRQLVRIGQFGLLRHVIDLGGQDLLQVIGSGGGLAGHGLGAGRRRAQQGAQKSREILAETVNDKGCRPGAPGRGDAAAAWRWRRDAHAVPVEWIGIHSDNGTAACRAGAGLASAPGCACAM
ncbi:hypothetical protein CT19431_190026 [Cupriavidus taiwanensis]|nr:hypothetical protein CT19431_190026 [Cupriavidus taiwanensis]